VVSTLGRRAQLIGARSALIVVVLVNLAAVSGAVRGNGPSAHAQTPGPPNIILLLTDDQRFDTLHVMPQVQRLLQKRGMTLRRAIVTNPVCCPSRATILTGRYSHTTGVYANAGEHGGWETFKASESSTIATALDAAGYRTGLIGKYLNGYTGDGIYVPPGWDRWFAFAAPNGRYYNYTMFDDLRGYVSFGTQPKDYSTDAIRRQAVSFIRSTAEDTPLFLMVTPFAPHGNHIAAPRHDGDLATARVSLRRSVNEADMSDKPAYLQLRPTTPLASIKRRTRDQWETLLAVDDMVARIVAALHETGRADNTMLIFTSDNGLLNHEHRWIAKQVPYEESIRVPMVISFPGQIPSGTVSAAIVSNLDIAPTVVDFAGASLPTDGTSMRPLLTDATSSIRESIALEHLGPSPPTYCGVRTPTFVFVRYVTGEEELYDLVQDPWQLENVASVRPSKASQLRALTVSLCQPVPPGFSW
jgi:arylsulfatase A-like enzyme